MQVYKANGVTLNEVTLVNGHAGLLVNTADVTANGIHTKVNGFGGIEVFAEANETSSFTTDGEDNSHDDEAGKPAIWKDGTSTNEQVNAVGYEVNENTGNDGKQTYYILENQ